MNDQSKNPETAKETPSSEITEEGPPTRSGVSPALPVTGGDPSGPSSVPAPAGGVSRPSQPPSGFGKGVNDYLNHYVTIADAKAGAILAANLAVAAALLDNQPDTDPLFRYRAALAMLGISSLLCVIVVFPRLPGGGGGAIFWEDIRKRASLAVYTSQVRSLDEKDVETEYASQNWWVSQLLHRKFRYAQWAIGTFCLALVLSAWWALGS